jgi:hypothetical protein
MEINESNRTTIVGALEGRIESFTLGVRYGYALAVDPGACPPLSQKTIGVSLNQWESGYKVGYVEGFKTLKQQ